MKNVKIKSLPLATKTLVGLPVTPNNQAKVGRDVQHLMDDKNYQTNWGKGEDLPQLGVEIKTRDLDSDAPHTIGKIKIKDIIKNQWETSSLFRKTQQHFKVYHSSSSGKIEKTEMIDYRTKFVQEKFKESYNNAKKIIQEKIDNNENIPKYIRAKDCWGYFENTDPSRPEWYDFRFSDSNMKKLNSMSKSNFSNLFDQE